MYHSPINSPLTRLLFRTFWSACLFSSAVICASPAILWSKSVFLLFLLFILLLSFPVSPVSSSSCKPSSSDKSSNSTLSLLLVSSSSPGFASSCMLLLFPPFVGLFVFDRFADAGSSVFKLFIKLLLLRRCSEPSGTISMPEGLIFARAAAA